MSEAKPSEALGQFGHHPDPAIDFCVEVEELEAIYTDRCNRFANASDADLEKRLERAMAFRVGGDLHAINAKDRLRKLETDLFHEAIERADRIRNHALELADALDAMLNDTRRPNLGGTWVQHWVRKETIAWAGGILATARGEKSPA